MESKDLKRDGARSPEEVIPDEGLRSPEGVKPEDNAASVGYAPGRGLFAGLMVFAALAVVVVGFFFWYVPTVGLGTIHPSLPYILGVVVLAVTLYVATGVVVITVSIMKGRELKLSRRYRWLLIKILMPLVAMGADILKIERLQVEQAFIELSNAMVKSMVRGGQGIKGFNADTLLLLMPHCIQWDDCKMKVTRDVRSCVGCNKCEIGELLELSDEYGVDLFVATGGTVARRKVEEHRSHVVVAVACERDLTSGIQDAYPLPVLAIINKRPHGYCLNAGVDVEDVKRAVRELLGTPPAGTDSAASQKEGDHRAATTN